MSFPRLRRRGWPAASSARPGVACSALTGRDEMPGDEVDDVEAFLAGCLVEHLSAAGRPVPAWAVLNKVAHAGIDELADLARSAGGVGATEGREPVWRCAQRSLAADLVGGAGGPDEVVSTQRAVLVPLELWLIERSQAETISSRRAIEMAADVLADHRLKR